MNALVWQDPRLALNPRFLSGGASQEGLDKHCGKPRGGAGDIDVKLVVKHSLAGVNCSLVLGFRD